MKFDELTILTVTFNNNLLTGAMLKSFNKQVGKLPEVIIVDNGDTIQADDNLKLAFNVIDNFNHKILEDEKQASRNHASAIDYALKNCIKTKWCLLVDNDILFKPEIKDFIENIDTNKCDCAGQIGWDCTPPTRIFPYLCLINVDKFKNDKLNYFDRNRITNHCTKGLPYTFNRKYDRYDTGYSFYEDIKKSWRIYNFNLNTVCIHLKSGMLANKNIEQWIYLNRNLL